MTATVAQIVVRTGDLEGNTKTIVEAIENHKVMEYADPSLRPSFIVFPELAICGYNNGALFENMEFIDECFNKIKEIASHVGDQAVIVGAPRYSVPRRKKNGDIKLHNSAFVLHEGKIVGVYDKIHLANANQHEDRKYFYPGKDILTMHLNGVTFGVLICEDIWKDDHERDLLAEMKHKSPDLEAVFCLNYSYFTYEKQNFRKELLARQSRENDVSIAYVNAVGIGDIVKNIICYDGQSLVYNNKGEKIYECHAFEKEIANVELLGGRNSFDPFKAYPPFKGRDIAWADKYHGIWKAQTFAVREMWAACGLKNALVAVSGGVDSAVVAVLAAKSLTPTRCIFVSMPSDFNGAVTKGAAQTLADKLKVPLQWVPIQESVNQLNDAIDNRINGYEKISSHTGAQGGIQATVRSVIGLGMCHMHQAGILATGNHTENILGWCTFHDIGSIGVFQPIGDLTKTELFELCEWINWYYREELIPEGLWNGQIKPMAELADSHEDPFDYYLMSGICAEMIRHRKTQNQLIEAFKNKTLYADYFPEKYDESRVLYTVYTLYTLAEFEDNVKEAFRRAKLSVYKSAQHAPALILSPRSRGFSSRETIINFYNPKVEYATR